jgi:cellulose synthase/poly-beta-1,6-N-acetylglucosamine synthase-like glycosyltransferase
MLCSNFSHVSGVHSERNTSETDSRSLGSILKTPVKIGLLVMNVNEGLHTANPKWGKRYIFPSHMLDLHSFLFGIATTFSAFYAGMDCVLRARFRAGQRKFAGSAELQDACILVCARNEEDRIEACLESLLNQDFPAELLEIWIADDRSTDRTAAIVEAWKPRFNGRLHLLQITENPLGMSPKKNALSQLIQHSKAPLILTTDADCIAPKGWARSLASAFTPEVQMVLGRSAFLEPQSGSKIFWGTLNLEFQSHFVVSAGAIGAGVPLNSTGNSLAYRRSMFESVGGFQEVAHIASGDDDLLLHKCHRAFPGSIRFSFAKDAGVLTEAPQSWREFWEQRKRWASKTVHYTPGAVVLLSSIFAYYCAVLGLFVLGPILSLITGDLFWLGLGLWIWGLKTLADAWALAPGLRAFGATHLWKWFPLAALLQVPYIVGAVVFGILGKFDWKGQGLGRKA